MNKLDPIVTDDASPVKGPVTPMTIKDPITKTDPFYALHTPCSIKTTTEYNPQPLEPIGEFPIVFVYVLMAIAVLIGGIVMDRANVK